MILTCVSFKIAVQNFSVFSDTADKTASVFSFTEIAVGDCAIDDFPTLVISCEGVSLWNLIFSLTLSTWQLIMIPSFQFVRFPKSLSSRMISTVQFWSIQLLISPRFIPARNAAFWCHSLYYTRLVRELGFYSSGSRYSAKRPA